MLQAQEKSAPPRETLPSSSKVPAVAQTPGLAGSPYPTGVGVPPLSLAADQILAILRDQPGLVLEIKKDLIRRAYQQGRILTEEDLTDDALYSLIESDARIRAIATREIESRGYLPLRPTKAELERQERERLARDIQRQKALAAAAASPAAPEPGPQVTSPPATTDDQTPDQVPAAPPSSPDRPTRVQRAGAFPENDLVPMTPAELPGVIAAGDPSDGVVKASRRKTSSADIPAELPAGLPPGWEQNDDLAPEPNSPAPTRPAVVSTRNSASIRAGTHHEPNPFANVPALYDLYVQASRQAPAQRFGMDLFRPGGNLGNLPMDLPAGPDYILGPGDGLKINMWGGVSGTLQRVVDREGRISLPESAPIMAAGRSLGDVQREVQAVLRAQFRDERADISLARLRAVRIYVVGDVAHPGAYDVSSLSSPLNAVYAAGGPTAEGSLRIVRHLRGKQLVQEVDVYDLILHGVRADVMPLQPGDTILVPPIGQQVTVEGMVRRPAIYEVRGERTLADVLEMAGGVLPTGTLRQIEVERLQPHQGRTMLSVRIPDGDPAGARSALQQFAIQDGDKIRLSPILAATDKAVYLEGHVFRPGKYAFHDGMKVTDLIGSYESLLPQPSRTYAEIIRLAAPDYTPTVLAFNLGNVLDGKTGPPVLQPFDTVRVFSRYDFEDAPEITVTGEVRDPGLHRTNGETRLRDAIYLAGGLTQHAQLTDAQVFRTQPGGEVKVISVNLARALAGDDAENVVLESKDRLIIHRNLGQDDPPSVTVRGEVENPGRYPLGEDMTAAQLVRVAGGLKRSAYRQSADLARYELQGGKKVVGEHQEIPIGPALAGVADTDVRLFDGDVLTIRQLSGWKEVGASVTVSGQVAHPGTYGIREGERLSSIIERAGGFRQSAYPYGAVLERVQVREIAENSRQELIRRLENAQASGTANIGSAPGGEQLILMQAANQQRQQALTALKTEPPSGRMVVHLSADLNRWKETGDDIEVRSGDTLFVPKRPNFIVATGQVNSSSAITFRPGKNAGWYLQQAGGLTQMADKKAVFIIRADGSVVGGGGGLFKGNALSQRLQPGDTIVVPAKIIGGNLFWRNMLNTAQIASSLAIAARVATSF